MESKLNTVTKVFQVVGVVLLLAAIPAWFGVFKKYGNLMPDEAVAKPSPDITPRNWQEPKVVVKQTGPQSDEIIVEVIKPEKYRYFSDAFLDLEVFDDPSGDVDVYMDLSISKHTTYESMHLCTRFKRPHYSSLLTRCSSYVDHDKLKVVDTIRDIEEILDVSGIEIFIMPWKDGKAIERDLTVITLRK